MCTANLHPNLTDLVNDICIQQKQISAGSFQSLPILSWTETSSLTIRRRRVSLRVEAADNRCDKPRHTRHTSTVCQALVCHRTRCTSSACTDDSDCHDSGHTLPCSLLNHYMKHKVQNIRHLGDNLSHLTGAPTSNCKIITTWETALCNKTNQADTIQYQI